MYRGADPSNQSWSSSCWTTLKAYYQPQKGIHSALAMCLCSVAMLVFMQLLTRYDGPYKACIAAHGGPYARVIEQCSWETRRGWYWVWLAGVLFAAVHAHHFFADWLRTRDQQRAAAAYTLPLVAGGGGSLFTVGSGKDRLLKLL